MPRVYPAMPGRFWAKVDKRDDDECWNWTAARHTDGYGRIKYQGRNTYAHRVSLIIAGIDIPTGMHVDHLCENTRCVNPAHLDVVTSAENARRSRELSNI